MRSRRSAKVSDRVLGLPTVAVAALVAGVAIEIGFLALLIPGFILWVRLSVVAQAAVLETGGVRAALRRSWHLTRFDQGHILGLLLIIGVLVAGSAFGALALGTGSDSSPGVLALGIAINTIVASFTALTTALLYFDLQARELSSPRPTRVQHTRRLNPAGETKP